MGRQFMKLENNRMVSNVYTYMGVINDIAHDKIANLVLTVAKGDGRGRPGNEASLLDCYCVAMHDYLHGVV